MKNLSLVFVALLLTTSVFADEVPTKTEPLSLTSTETSASSNLEAIETADLGALLDKEVKEVSDLVSAKITAELPALFSKEAPEKVKF